MTISIDKKLYKEIKRAGEEQGWWSSAGILVAVSGGSDSMALLALLHRFYGGRLAAAHIEHGLRGEKSLADAEFVRAYCKESDIPCYVRHADIPNSKYRGESSEMAGRRARYEFFNELMKSEGLDFTATGHTAGDLVETMVFHLFRGTGISGLKGISPRRGRFVRPVINCRREELRAFLVESGIAWCEDETNLENCYQRNKIRNQLLPWVRKNINAETDRVLLGLGSECSEINEENSKRARELLKWSFREHPCSMAALDTSVLRGLRRQELVDVIREQGRALGLPLLDRKRMNDLCRLILSSTRWRFQWAFDVEVCGGSGLIGWVKRDGLTAPEQISVEAATLTSQRSVNWGSWLIELTQRHPAADDSSTSDNSDLVLSDKLYINNTAEGNTPDFNKSSHYSADRQSVEQTERLIREGLTGGKSSGSRLHSLGWSSLIRCRMDEKIYISSAECTASEVSRRLPWWSRAAWPSIYTERNDKRRIWVPGIFNKLDDDVHDGCSCVIIAKVFCCYNRRLKGEQLLVRRI